MTETLDVVSGGRLVLGVGVGWMEEEFRIERLAEYAELGVTSFGLDCRVDGIDVMSATLDALAPVLDPFPPDRGTQNVGGRGAS